ncbi:MAG: peptidylprolyl isomerase [Vicinamibacterales bacterium]|jgi:peptidyl-prolyl cis-trans isomerase B (cyclophilin B)
MSVRILTFVLASVLAGVVASAAQPAPAKPAPAKTPAPAAKPGQTSPGAGPVIVVETEKGTFEFETYPNEAPKTVAHIIGLVNKRFYNGQRVHRVVPGFVIQMGDPATRDMTKQAMWGTGGSGTPIGAAEISKTRTHVRGAVAMAHAGDASKADSQFYVTLADVHRLDSDYTVFGKIISGMDVVMKIAQTDRIVRVTVRGAK